MSKKFNTIVFRNYFNHGDLHAVRSFIKYIKDNIEGYDFKLNHPKHIKTLGDLNLPLFWKPVPNQFDNRGYHVEYNTLFINTQYLAFNGIHFNKYSATLLTAWNIFNQTLKEVFNIGLPTDYKMFLPRIDYNCNMYSNIKNIDRIMECPMVEKKKVLICNNDFGSEQAMRFDFDPLIYELSRTFRDVTFFITNNSNICDNNIRYVGDIVGPCEGNDLNEISYLSTKCDVLIGRNSGPHTFSYVYENIMNPEKKFISFSAPSNLYGRIPENWIDFGTHIFVEKNEHAQFLNVVKNTDKERIYEVSKIIGG